MKKDEISDIFTDHVSGLSCHCMRDAYVRGRAGLIEKMCTDIQQYIAPVESREATTTQIMQLAEALEELHRASSHSDLDTVLKCLDTEPKQVKEKLQEMWGTTELTKWWVWITHDGKGKWVQVPKGNSRTDMTWKTHVRQLL